MFFYPFVCKLPVALSLPVAIINQPMFTSDVAMCEMHGIHHPGNYILVMQQNSNNNIIIVFVNNNYNCD